jgi:voltage-gated potassium channel Kch
VQKEVSVEAAAYPEPPFHEHQGRNEAVLSAAAEKRPCGPHRFSTVITDSTNGRRTPRCRSEVATGAGSLAVLDAERGKPGANITTFGDALWWATTTVTTVGYGDRFPTTGQGRLIAGLLMLGGIALLGVVTASLASWLLDRVREVEEESRLATRRDIHALSEQVAELKEELQTWQNNATAGAKSPE